MFEKTGFKLEGGYATAVKEGVSRATVGEGSIGIRDTAAQAALEASGKTGKLAALNRGLDLAQEVTRDERESVNFYVSDTSLKAVRDVAKKASSLLTELIEEGKILGVDERQKKELLKKIEDGEIDLRTTGVCTTEGGANHGWLHNLLFTPAYAAPGDGCIIRFLGADKLYDKDGIRISEEDHAKLRAALASAAQEKLLDLIPTVERLKTTHPDSPMYRELNNSLQTYLGYFALCADDDRWTGFIAGTPLLKDPAYASHLKVAQSYKLTMDQFAEQHGSFADKKAPAVVELRQKNPGLYNALVHGDVSKIDERVIDGTLYLMAATGDKGLSADERKYVIETAAKGIAAEVQRSVSRRELSSAAEYINSEILKTLSPDDARQYQSTLNGELIPLLTKSTLAGKIVQGLVDSFEA